jgi:hypothetical protein
MPFHYNTNFETFGGVALLKERQHDCSGLLKHNIVVKDDCYFHGFLPGHAIGFSPSLQHRTGSECFMNKLHIDEKSSEKQFAFGVQYAVELSELLAGLGVGGFNVILSYDGKECTVTFHKSREGEVYLTADLNDYQREGILLIS